MKLPWYCLWLRVTVANAGILLLAASSSALAQSEDETDECDCPFSFESTVSEMGGQKYRKIGLSGIPISDAKPQAEEETDQVREETFVDALNHTLTHRVTDVYIPLGGSDLALSVERNLTPDIWNDQSGLSPRYSAISRPDRPFGYGWTTNIGANIEIVTQEMFYDTQLPEDCPKQGPPNDYAVVTDENGITHRYLIFHGISGSYAFFPSPEGRHDVDAYANTLKYVDGKFVFRKKHGTTLTFEMSSVDRAVDGNLFNGFEIDALHVWARLTSIKDRHDAGSGSPTISYVYNSENNGLIPDQITARCRSITITHGAERITKIQDARGNEWTYSYESKSGIQSSQAVLSKVTSPIAGETKYTYAIASEEDPTPAWINFFAPANTYYFLDLKKITDPNGREYSFNYGFDHSRRNNTIKASSEGAIIIGDTFYPAPGNPRNVTSVTTAAGTAYFVNKSLVKVIWGLPIDETGEIRSLPPDDTEITRWMEVTDAANHKRTWNFAQPRIFLMNFLETLLSWGETDRRYPWNIAYQQMVLTHPNGGTERFNFSADAAMQLAGSVDLCGNGTSFQYADTVSAGNFPFIVDPGFTVGHYGDPTKQTDALGKIKTFAYDSKWRLMTQIVDELSRKTVYDLDPVTAVRTRERVYSPDDTLVRDTEFQYENSNFPGFMTRKIEHRLPSDPTWMQNAVTKYIPEAITGNIYQEIIDPGSAPHLNLTTTYTYDANNNKKTITDPRGKITTFTYDNANRLTTTLFHDGTTRVLTPDLRGNKKTETDENQHVTRYAYDGVNRLKKKTLEMETGTDDDIVTEYGYNAVGSKTSETDPRGGVTTFEYDALQRLIKVTDAANKVTLYDYDAARNFGGSVFDTSSIKPTKITDPRGFVTDVTYNKVYREINKSVTYKIGTAPAVTETEYDDAGNVTKVTDPLDKETSTEYDDLNHPIKITYADGKFRRSYFTSTGLKWKERDEFDAAERETETEYDAATRPVKVTGPLVEDGYEFMTRPITVTEYDAAGNIAATINRRGYQWDYAYDDRNRKVEEQAPSIGGRPTTGFGYDDAGNLTSVTDPRGFTTDYEYDAANRKTREEGPSVAGIGRPTTITEYDKNGNITVVTDPNNHVTTNTYDVLNRLETTTDAEDILVTYEYDEAGNRTAVIDGKNQRTEFEYDGLSRNTKIIDAAAKATTFEYDAVNKTARVDAKSQRTEYQYDDRHRLTQVNYIGRSQDNRTYSYDDAGNLLAAAIAGYSGLANSAYTYDNLNRQATETSAGYTHAYKYDLAGNRIYALYGGGSNPLTSTYDALNRLKTLAESSRITTYAYDPNGNVLTKALPNGDVIASTYDALNRRRTLGGAGYGGTLYGYSYIYDAAGNVTQATETYGNTALNRVVGMSYDDINRLAQETVTGNGAATTSYTYDDANNRETMTRNGVLTSYNCNSLNQLTTVSQLGHNANLSYDANGNLSSKLNVSGTTPLAHPINQSLYDYENRVVGLQLNNFVGEYIYDYRSRRVRNNGQSGGTYVFSDGNWIRRTGGSTTVYCIRGLHYGGGVGGILYTLRNGVPNYTHDNRRGDIVAKTDQSGLITYQAEYSAFGQRTAQTGTTNDEQFANSKDETPYFGLLNEGLRYRDPETGTFLTRDPAGFVDGPNLYAYVKQNPWTKFDPQGLSPDEERAVAEMLNQMPETAGFADDVQNHIEGAQGVSRVTQGVVAAGEGIASLNPVQNLITARTGKGPLNESVSRFDQGMAIGGVVAGPGLKIAGKFLGEAKAAISALKGGEKAAGALNDANKAAATGVKIENSAKDVAEVARTSGARTQGTRYVGEGEANVISETGRVPNTDAAGKSKTVFYTHDKPLNSASEAQEAYNLSSKPTHRVTVDTRSAKPGAAGNVEGGTGTEMMTDRSLPAKSDPKPLDD